MYAVAQSWRRVWEQVIPFFDFPLEVDAAIFELSCFSYSLDEVERITI